MFYIAFAALALVVPGQTQASDAAPPPAQKEKKICRREEVTGSIMPKRVCRTAEEWRQIDKTSGVDENQMNHLRGQMH